MLLRFFVLPAILLYQPSCISTLNYFGHGNERGKKQQVLLLSFDGFGWNYLSDGFVTKWNLSLPNFDRLKKIGVYSPFGNIPPYVTETFPSHFSTATGLYIESHGIVGNSFYYPKLKKQFQKWYKDSQWWDQGEPIWITAKRQNLSSGVFFWPGSGVTYNGVSPTWQRDYNASVSFKTRIQTVVGWLRDGIDVVCAYFHEPDKSGHKFGPDSLGVAAAVKRMDDVLGDIINHVQSKDLKDKVNVLLTSDHGMYSISKDKTISLYDHIDVDDVNITGTGEFVQLYPSKFSLDDTFDLVAQISPHLKFYRRRDIPASFHYGANERVAPIVGFADLGWLALKNASDARIDWNTNKGSHGWANTFPQMRPIFFAFGPAFKAGVTTPSFETVNYYALICHLLNIAPAPNNGTIGIFDNVLTMGFRNGTRHGSTDWIVFLLTLAFIFFFSNWTV